MKAVMLALEKSDEIALQYLGAAAAVQWGSMPEKSRNAILLQAANIGGLPYTTSLHEHIKSLIRRYEAKDPR